MDTHEPEPQQLVDPNLGAIVLAALQVVVHVIDAAKAAEFHHNSLGARRAKTVMRVGNEAAQAADRLQRIIRILESTEHGHEPFSFRGIFLSPADHGVLASEMKALLKSLSTVYAAATTLETESGVDLSDDSAFAMVNGVLREGWDRPVVDVLLQAAGELNRLSDHLGTIARNG